MSHTPGYGVAFGPRSKAALLAKFTNRAAPAITETDFIAFASRMNVPVGHVKGVRKVEAPQGSFNDQGRPTILYERHVGYRNLEPDDKASAAATAPGLFFPKGYGKGGYGAYSVQYDKLAAACAIDPHAAFAACSWGAFQVLGENAVNMGYVGPFDMALSLVESEAAHLETLRRFIVMKGLEDELRACRPNDPDSCIPFVRRYNGEGFREFNYHVKLAKAIAV